ncbi:MAG: hypothetical protein ABIB46_06275 [bacterium]
MIKEHYYCNKCNRKHYKGSKIYNDHKSSANTGQKQILTNKMRKLIQEHNQLSKKIRASKEEGEKRSQKHKGEATGTHSTEIYLRDLLEEQGRYMRRKGEIQKELKELGYKQKGL